MSDFREECTITDEAGVIIAVITSKFRSNGSKLYSFSFLRAFDDGGQSRRTPWCNSRHVEAIARLLPKVKVKLEELEDTNA